FCDGVDYTFPQGTIFPAETYLVIAEDSSQAYSPVTVSQKYGIPASLVMGPFSGSLNNEGENIALCDAEGNSIDRVDYVLGFPWPTVGDAVPDVAPGGTGHSIQLIHSALDNNLAGSWRSAYPTPGDLNTAVVAENCPPQIRQVNHSPQQPKSGQIVTITAKVTDPDGVASVDLHYQVVNPGSYINLNDPSYNTWNSLVMLDNGQDGDIAAGDDVYTVQLPAFVQEHRRLIRYRITVADTKGLSLRVPYADDPQPNFAYFVYDGVPAWSGAINPNGAAPLNTVRNYSPVVMRSLPVYHLISKQTDVENATWISKYTGDDYLWSGTLVYDGKVYDHIRYRARGGVWRYSMGKNMWKFDFNRGHYFQARDDYGQKYDTTWAKLNFSACIQQGDYGHRGEQGMFEAAGFKLFNMMGVESPKTHWVQFRIVDGADENGTTQYNGDLWGLYLVLEQMDGRYLDEHNLPDGNLYKIDDYNGALNNQGETQPANGSDYAVFKNAWYGNKPTESWWRGNVDLNRYYSYRCVVEGIHHGDIGYGKNYFFYHDPFTSRWTMYPWDLDLTWANTMYGNGEEPFKNINQGAIFNFSSISLEYQNRLREFHDLLYNTDQLHAVLDELAAIVDSSDDSLSVVDMDRAMWDYNPVMINSSIVNTSKAGQGRFYQAATTKNFPGMVQIMKNYVTGSRAFSTYSEDAAAPVTPAIGYIGSAGYPTNDLRFQTSAFSDPQGASTFAAMKWRIAEVCPFSKQPLPTIPGGGSTEPTPITLIPRQTTWKYFKGTAEPSSPVDSWRQPGFNDNDWAMGQTSIGFADNDDNTVLSDMHKSYYTVYLRNTFDISDVSRIQNLTLQVYVDDGCIIWINGHEVSRPHCPTGQIAYNQAIAYNHDAGSYEEVVLTVPYDYLIHGTNVIAVQAIQSSTSSSDFSIDVSVAAELAAQPGPEPFYEESYAFRVTPGKYEIDAVWESAEQTAFTSTIAIPGSVVKPDRTYRVRCRMKDNTGRWSHWSNPVEFVAGQPLGGGVLDSLRITELMYNPAADTTGAYDSEEYEFIELKNIGTTTISLNSVTISDGITCDFAAAPAALRTLGAGQYVLVVKNKAAFESRYGTGVSDRIAGQYSGKLSNSGETLLLNDFWNGTIVQFTFNDGLGWPAAADGGGHSLVVNDYALEDQPFGTLDYGGNWRASTYRYGSPGQDDPAAIVDVR
ncbi:MAG: lamin tail domain-containing protein, partial [Sedimentisphaerales bacterium]|nr:lamin tail domain-containing protein [Sedimentisphaerales bacterium]